MSVIDGKAVVVYPTDPDDVKKVKGEILELQEELEHGGDPDIILPQIASKRDLLMRLYNYADELKEGKIKKKKRVLR